MNGKLLALLLVERGLHLTLDSVILENKPLTCPQSYGIA